MAIVSDSSLVSTFSVTLHWRCACPENVSLAELKGLPENQGGATSVRDIKFQPSIGRGRYKQSCKTLRNKFVLT